jgi:subtilisin family serine protease
MAATRIFAVIPLLVLAACGGGAERGPAPLPAPTPAPAPAPSPAPTPAPTPEPAPAPAPTSFDTAEYRRSNGAVQASALAAYDAGASGAGVLAAVVDSGVNAFSPEFAGRVSPQSRDFAGVRGIADEDGHGTSISGILLAARNNSGIQGVAWGATLLALRVDSPGSCASTEGCSYGSSAIAQAIDFATVSGARVINLSLGGGSTTLALRSAAARAAAAGVVTVISAGNDAGAQIDALAAGLLAAGPSTTLVVGAVDGNRQIADFSNRAGSAAGNYLVALGVGVRSFDQNGTTFLYSGTSESAPLVSGAVVLLAQAFPALAGAQIAEILLRSADDLGAPGVDAVYGRGALNIARAFQPLGATSVAGVARPLGLASGSLGPAFGDLGASGQALGQVAVRDSYGRDYLADLSSGLRAAARGRLAAALLVGGGDVASVAAGPVRVGFVADGDSRRQWHGDRLTGAQPGFAATPATGHIRLAFAGHGGASRAVVMGFGRSAATLLLIADDSVVVPNMLVAGQEVGPQPMGGAAFAQALGGWTASLAVAQTMLPASRFDFAARQHTALLRLARRAGPLAFAGTLELGQEQGSLLGTRLASVFGIEGSSRVGAALAARLALGSWALAGEVRRASVYGRLAGGGLLAGLEPLAASNGWVALERHGHADRFTLMLAQPERATGAGLWQRGIGPERFALTPSGRETAIEFGWARALAGGEISFNLYGRRQPGHVAGAPADLGGALRFVLRPD